MKKFLVIVKAFWQRSLTYRFTILAYRIGEVAEMLALILMWSAIYASQKVVGGLSNQEMITYILVGNFFNAVTRNFLSNVVARDIKNGSLSVFLIRPISYFNYILSEEIGRISLAAVMSLSASLLVIIFFSDVFVANFDWSYIMLIVVMIMLAFVTELLLSYLVGLVAFWTDEVEGVYSTIDRIRKFFSGGYFPINLLPPIFVQTSLALPFAYSFFVPAQLYLKKLSLTVGLRGLLLQLVWIFILYAVSKIVWKRGLKKYEGVGI